MTMTTLRWLIFGVLIFFSLGVVRGVLKRRQARENSMAEYAKTPEGFTQAMSEIAAFAVEDAKKEFAVELDYSPDSVQNVEKILGQIHDKHTQTPLANKEIFRRELRFGVYIGEVIRRKYNGTWKVVDPKDYSPAAFEISYRNKENRSRTGFPVNWCGKRIFNGDEDNVWFKYLVLVEEQGKTIYSSKGVGLQSRQ
jgi:hypothetical protein